MKRHDQVAPCQQEKIILSLHRAGRFFLLEVDNIRGRNNGFLFGSNCLQQVDRSLHHWVSSGDIDMSNNPSLTSLLHDNISLLASMSFGMQEIADRLSKCR